LVKFPINKRNNAREASMRNLWQSFGIIAASALCIAPAFADNDHAHGNFALAFKGNPGLVATAPGSPVTLQTDNLRLEALVMWAGPPNQGGMIVYNGHGCCSGWGILLLGDADGPDAHKLGVLAGGITVVTAPVMLPVGEWTQVVMERRAQDVTLTVTGTGKHDRPQTFDLGIIPANPLGVDNRVVSGGTVRTTEKLSIGENFNGLIDNVAVRTLDTKQTIDSWRFNDVTGFIATGKNGHVLNLQAAEWIDISHDQGVDDDRD
jgi:hypothetical protein